MSMWRIVSVYYLIIVIQAQDSGALNGFQCQPCPKGKFYLSPCKEKGGTPQCSVCPKGKFTDDNNMATSCKDCKVCMMDQIKISSCTPTSDTVCRCAAGKYWLAYTYFEGICLPHRQCNDGEIVLFKGTPTADTICAPVSESKLINILFNSEYRHPLKMRVEQINATSERENVTQVPEPSSINPLQKSPLPKFLKPIQTNEETATSNPLHETTPPNSLKQTHTNEEPSSINPLHKTPLPNSLKLIRTHEEPSSIKPLNKKTPLPKFLKFINNTEKRPATKRLRVPRKKDGKRTKGHRKSRKGRNCRRFRKKDQIHKKKRCIEFRELRRRRNKMKKSHKLN